jgi:hypothetical protein
VLDPLKGAYVHVTAVDQAYAKGLSFWQNKVIRRYAQQQLNARTGIVALAQAKAEIRALVERDFNRKSTRGRKRHARFMEDHATATVSEPANAQPAADGNPDVSEMQPCPNATKGPRRPPAETSPARSPVTSPDAFTDDEILPVFEADLNLPHMAVAGVIAAKNTSGMEESQ